MLRIKKDKLSNKWKLLKRNGNDRRKRKELIQGILEPWRGIHNKAQSNEVLNNNRSIEVTEANFTVNNLSVSDEYSNDHFESEQSFSCECRENLHEDGLNSELEESNFPEIALQADKHVEGLSLSEDLRQWGANHSITQTALNDLLDILNSKMPELCLPKDARTIMGTPRDRIVVQNDGCGGAYWHYGIEKAVKNCLNHIDFQRDILLSVNINIDGLPLFKSSRVEFWPILINIYEMPEIPPMVVGIYCGKGTFTEEQ